MLKNIIFLLFFVSIFSNTKFNDNNYLDQLYNLAFYAEPKIIDDYKYLFPLDEKPRTLKNILTLEEQIGRNSAFDKKKNDILEIKEFQSITDAQQEIIEYIANYSIRRNKTNDLGEFFVKNMNYDDHWNKYDLLVFHSKGFPTGISSLSVYTKKVGSKFVNVYFVTIKRIKYRYNAFILINKAESENNPFSKFYSIKVYNYIYKDSETNKFQSKEILEKDDTNIHLYKEVLMKYYRILFYSAIADKIKKNFIPPFELYKGF